MIDKPNNNPISDADTAMVTTGEVALSVSIFCSDGKAAKTNTSLSDRMRLEISEYLYFCVKFSCFKLYWRTKYYCTHTLRDNFI